MNEKLRHAPIGVLETSTDGEIRAANPAATTILGVTRENLVGHSVDEALPRSATGTLRDAFFDDRPLEQSIEEYFPEIGQWLEVDLLADDDGATLYVADRTHTHEQERTIDRLEQRLGRLETIDSLVATVLQKVIGASAREEVWRTICERLGATELYEFAWVGKRDLTDGRLRTVASAGSAPEMRQTIDTELGSNGRLPEQRAVETESTQVVQTIADEESIPRDVRVTAFGSGLQSCIAVPLVHGETIYGVVGVYATRQDGFSEQEVASLETLAAIAGFAVNAIKQEDLLFADNITELTIEVSDERIPFVEASAAAGGPLLLEGAVVRDDDVMVCYLRTDSKLDEMLTTLENHGATSTVRTVEAGEETPVLEVTISGGTPLTTLANWGATITDATYTAESAEIVAELPDDGDIRDAVEAVDTQFSQTDIRAKEQRRHEPETMEAFKDDLTGRLTDKQRTVLETAYLADYFMSPRGSTSEEVAQALDIAGPTVLYHLRNAQQELLDAFFEESTTTGTNR